MQRNTCARTVFEVVVDRADFELGGAFEGLERALLFEVLV